MDTDLYIQRRLPSHEETYVVFDDRMELSFTVYSRIQIFRFHAAMFAKSIRLHQK